MKTSRSFAFWLSLITISVIAAAWAVCVCSVRWGGPEAKDIIEGYQKNARTPIFTGFFTMGSFLIALKTTILARVKETYDTQAYKVAFRAKRQLDPNAKFYGGLQQLGKALGLNLVFCLAVSLLQLTLGFWANPLAFAICVGGPLTCFGLLIRLTIVILDAHKDWFEKIEVDAKAEIDALDKANQQKQQSTE